MTQLTADQVRHISKLARLTLKDGEVETYAKEMSSIMTYIDMLSEVDTSKVEATAGGTSLVNSVREDIIQNPTKASPDELLGTSPLPIEDHQIETPSAHASASSAQAF